MTLVSTVSCNSISLYINVNNRTNFDIAVEYNLFACFKLDKYTKLKSLLEINVVFNTLCIRHNYRDVLCLRSGPKCENVK